MRLTPPLPARNRARPARALDVFEDDDRGLALITTLLILVLVGGLTAAALSGVLVSVRTSVNDYRMMRTFYAAEAGAEASLGQLQAALQDGALTEDDLASIDPPPLDGFDYTGFSARTIDTARVERVTDGAFAGLYALTQDIEIYSPASDATGAHSAVVLGVRARAIPIFQFGVFYEEDLESLNGPPMDFVGRVHSNGNIYLSSRNAWYWKPVTTPQKLFHDGKHAPHVYDGVYIHNAEEQPVQLDFDSRSHSNPEAFKAESEEKFDSRVQTDAFGVSRLNLPLPTGVPPYELIRPRELGADADPPAERSVKFAWLADTRVTVHLGRPYRGRAALCGAGGPPPPGPPGPPGPGGEKPDLLPEVTVERTHDRVVPAPGDVCRMFAWRWEAFFDGREWNLRDVLDVDIAAISDWVASDPDNRRMEIIYVEMVDPDNPPRPLNDLDDDEKGINPSVRVRNGQVLPNRLTVATEWPLYVLGDYNSDPVAKQPAALVGDAITILSNAWDDSEHDETPTNYRAWENDLPSRIIDRSEAAHTTVQAAILAGHSATPCDHTEPGCSPGYEFHYGGGLENFPRFLEYWGTGNTIRYVGSLVSLWQSRKATGKWALYYYKPPRRDWSFDTDFRVPTLLPPGTPAVGSVVKAAFREAY